MTRPGTQVLPRRWWALLLGAGAILLVLGAVMAVTYSLAFVQRGETSGGLSLPFVDAYPTTTDVLLPPFGAFLVGGCLTFVGELQRRGAIVRGYGNNIALFRPLGLVTHAFWIVVSLAVWVAIVPLTLSKASLDQAASPSLSNLDSGSDVVFLLGVYGGLVGAITGALVGSWVKKAWYLRTERRLGPPDPGSRSPGWWTFTYYWRADVWLVALGGLLLGIVPLPWFLESTTAAVVTAGIGMVLAVAGLASSTQYRRSGMPLGTGSSLTGGATTEAGPDPTPTRRNRHRQP